MTYSPVDENLEPVTLTVNGVKRTVAVPPHRRARPLFRPGKVESDDELSETAFGPARTEEEARQGDRPLLFAGDRDRGAGHEQWGRGVGRRRAVAHVAHEAGAVADGDRAHGEGGLHQPGVPGTDGRVRGQVRHRRRGTNRYSVFADDQGVGEVGDRLQVDDHRGLHRVVPQRDQQVGATDEGTGAATFAGECCQRLGAAGRSGVSRHRIHSLGMRRWIRG